MTRLHFQYLRQTDNIGDRSCSPYDYFTLQNATVSDIRHDDTPDYDVGVYGGGKIFGGLSHYDGVRRGPGQVNIAWCRHRAVFSDLLALLEGAAAGEFCRIPRLG